MKELLAKKTEPHPATAALAIAAMALLVAAVLQFLGPVKALNGLADGWVASFGLEGEMRLLPHWVPWVWTIFATVGACQVILEVNGRWQRVIVVLSGLVLTLAWVPVLALAAYGAPVGVPALAFLWGGVGAVVYAERHRGPS